MIYPPELLDKLQRFPIRDWDGAVFRHMLNDYPPDRANTRGARWNPPEVAAIYTSLDEATAIAEGGYRLSQEPFPPRVRRVVYRIRVRLPRVLDLGAEGLETLGIDEDVLKEIDLSACQLIGGGVAWLGYDGLLVPSVRAPGTNLVIYSAGLDESDFEILDHNELQESS